MGSKKTTETQTSKVEGAGQYEEGYRQYLLAMGKQAGSQMGDLSALASGKGLTLSPEDLALINQAVGGQADISRTALERQFEEQNAQLTSDLGATGTKDSSIEMIKRLLQSGDQARALGDIERTRMSKGAEYGMALPFQRAQTQFGANAQLLAQMGVANPALQSYLQGRLGNVSTTGTTKQSGFALSDLAAFMPSNMSFGSTTNNT